MKLPELEFLLSYQHADVLKLYNQNYPNNVMPAETAFKETLKYLWLAKKHELDRLNNPDDDQLPPRCIMLLSMRPIDEMWHEFILFTQDYMNFCQTYFGEYMHHLPNLFDTMPRPREELLSEIERMIPYVYDNLGEETVRVWYAEYL